MYVRKESRNQESRNQEIKKQEIKKQEIKKQEIDNREIRSKKSRHTFKSSGKTAFIAGCFMPSRIGMDPNANEPPFAPFSTSVSGLITLARPVHV